MNIGWLRNRRWLGVLLLVLVVVSGPASVCSADMAETAARAVSCGSLWSCLKRFLGREWRWVFEKEGPGIDPWGPPAAATPPPAPPEAGHGTGPYN